MHFMKRILIGQYGGFDERKYNRDFRSSFYGIEACLFHNKEDEQRLVEEARKHDFHIGVHFPFRAGRHKLRDPLFIAKDELLRKSAFDLVDEELEYLNSIKPDYVLFHYPKPVILDRRVDWRNWRFAHEMEYVREDSFSFDEFIEKSECLFKWLTDKSKMYQFIPILEFDALNRYVYESEIVEVLLQKYPRVKLCLDTGRLYLQEKIDAHFNARMVLRKFSKYAQLIHLWNARYEDGIKEYHYPVLPELDPKDGWAPIEDYLNIIVSENKEVKIQFEHQSDLISSEDLERCYAWVESFFRRENGGA